MLRTPTLLLGLLALGAPAGAQGWSDDFNRPDGTDMGPDWSESYGEFIIENEVGRGQFATGNSKMVHTSASGHYASARAAVTLLPPETGGTRYVSLILGDGGDRNLFTKLQGTQPDGSLTHVWFYSKDNGGSLWSSTKVLDAPVFSCRFEVSISGDGDTLRVDIDTDFDGSADQHYEASGILSFAGELGEGFGIGTYGIPRFDDWEVDYEPDGLSATPAELSVSDGGSQLMTLDAGVATAGLPYLLLGSLSGTAPGFPVDALVLPLNFDAYTLHTLLTPNTAPLTGSFGALGSTGQATARFDLAPGGSPSLIGLQANHAFVVLELLPTLLHIVYVSDPAPLTFLP